MALNFNQFAAEANEFMKDYTKELMLDGDTEKAGRILSSTLHGLREVISFEESLQLMAQFPMFLKAVYVNGWSAPKKKRVKNINDFIDLVRSFDGAPAMYDFKSYELSEQYINSTFLLLRRYISSGELEDIRTELPKDLKSILHHRLMI
ncbi:MAG: DUF2267 domain-containing protein [Flavobacteriaceae bacterium]|nr:DUF2267 domain-containing protein [Flavobacteriaceae bacterium]